RAFSVGQSLALLEQLLFELRRLLRSECVDRLLGRAFGVALRISERLFDALGNDDPRFGVALASKEQVDEVTQAGVRAEHAHVPTVVGKDSSGVAHRVDATSEGMSFRASASA